MALARVQALSTKVDEGLSSAFGSLARAVTGRPILTIVATTALAVAFAPGMGMAGTQSEGDKLWVPQDTESQDQKKWVADTFGASDRRAQVFATVGGGNLLTRASLVALEKLHSGIAAVTAECAEGSCKGDTITYAAVMTKPLTSILSVWGGAAPPDGADILADVNDQSRWVTVDGRKLKIGDMLGGVTYESGNIVSAEALLTTAWLDGKEEMLESESAPPATTAWELAFDEYVKGFSNNDLPNNYPLTRYGQGQAGGSAIRGDVSMLSLGYMLLIAFSILVLSHHKRVQSNGVMALASILSVGLAIVSAFGLCGYLGVKQNPVTTTLFLVLLGIGVDDSYVIMGDYRLADGTPQERVVKALTKAGTSITVTTFTDTVAFAAGISSTLPALSDFCIFAAAGIFFDFFYQCTWFVAVLTLRARCTNDNRPDWLCCMRVDPESTGLCACSAPVCSRNSQCVCCPVTREVEGGKTDSVARVALRRITSLTLTPIGNIVVLIVTCGLLAGAVAGIPSLKSDFDPEWFTPDDNPYTKTFEVRDRYFPTTGKGLPVSIYTGSGDYAAAHADGSLAAVYQGAVACSVIDRSLGNWYTTFVEDAGRSDRAKASDAAFAAELQSFVTTSAGSRFANDIAFITASGGAASGIRASRSTVLAKETTSGKEDIELAETVRECVEGNTLDAFAYSSAFLFFDGLAVVDKECIQNVIIACVCVFVVNLLLLADLVAATLVLSMIALVDVCILGYMSHWDLDFNSVTAINLVLAVGLAVDYSAHIAHSFLVIRGPGVERAQEAVEHIGMSVLNGAFSTLLAVFPLALSKSYVFTVFFKMWFMIIVFGIYFGLIVLPVLLSRLGFLMGSPEKSTPESTKVQPGGKDHAVQVGGASEDPAQVNDSAHGA